ncbi:helix-turn-helix domain-containing protein [Mammaliicoccus stepanovicii]|uniref:AraC family transcriptional regulator n=1 Tax=Mammaliicoccus stepanovicii TaxID=643214 RepID=A0A239Z8X0_9STAP|nr:helix-turn-helix domain-containing protein [Mammaliicoccus stepanovicii]PNZ72704.1 AraC family transcriptional regulator [Mammaliicoccus stepanovicii]GGI39924.1 AraC family transcriptional regulator [Mammaliicoccus stepanovicii]SNV67034.1 AraC family transcriptional regulator [Mammaliicoccus stepanovicii]
MEVIKVLQRVIVYIEDNLLNTVDLQTLSEYVEQSPFHLNQTFTMIIGMTPSEYQTARRMTEAAQDILNGHTRIIDIALKYGYNDANSFAHDYSNYHGISPLQTKTHQSMLKIKKRVSIKLTATETEPLNYTLQYKDELNLVGKNHHYHSNELDNHFLIPDLLEMLIENNYIEDFIKYNDEKPNQLFVIRRPLLDGLEVFVGVPSNRYPGHLDNYYLPRHHFATFNLQGELDFVVSEAWHHIENQWQLKMPYVHDDFYVEVYPLDISFDQETTKVQLWMPIDFKGID